ncbi:MAG: beta-ketoacyl-ACP synthase II [Acidobacteria bacterium]|nr:beta-ketoacyl-ACP synthase II [Acidobacteriota bacterium]MDA1237100.1 beta-ketoacyl-ACP synthase II [Acidobacteriota bacterium]
MRRVVVTGVGLTCPVGIGTEESWQAILAGTNGIRQITNFDTEGFACKIAGEVPNFDPLNFVDKRDLKKMGRFIFFALASSEFAMRAAGFPEGTELGERGGVYIGSGIGGFDVIEREHRNLMEGGPRKISPFFIPATIINLASGHVSIRWRAKGPNSATATACTSSAHSIGDSFRLITRGDADVMICGGAEAAITPMSVGGFGNMKALVTNFNETPEKACRPWDKDRAGFVIGEGAGMVVLEELSHAVKRGAPIVAEVVGYGMSGDAFHITSPSEDGDGAFRVMRNAIKDAGIQPEDVDYVNAHATSTPVGDRIETTAVKRVFGEGASRVAISSTKSMTGHLLGGAGGLEAGIVALALRDQIAPPTMNLENPDEGFDLDYLPGKSRKMEMRYALSNSFGFGGTNGALVFKRYESK